MYENNIFLDSELKSKNLRGNILFHVVFVHNDTENWAEWEKMEFLNSLEEVTTFLTKEAATTGVPLHCSIKTTELKCNIPASDRPKGLETLLAKENDYDTASGYIENLKATLVVDDVPLIFVWRRCHGVWEFARPSADIGSCYVGERTWPSALLHEILHIYGAKDLYWKPIRDLVQYCFPDSVMNSPGLKKLTSQNIDSLTRYLIGWQEEPNAVAEFFLQQTNNITPQQYAAIRMTTKNELDTLFERITPFVTFAELQKSAAASDPFANFLLGYCYAHGIYLEHNLEAAERCYQLAFLGSCLPAGWELAILLLSKNTPHPNELARAQQILGTIEQHHVEAASLLAVCQYTGYGCSQADRDYALSEVITRYQHYNFANNGQFRKLPMTVQQHKLLEKMCQNLPNLLKAVKHYMDQYAEIEHNGDPVLFYLMGCFLENGQPRPNPKRALELYLKAAHLGLSAACSAVSSFYRNGIGTPVDTVAAQLWQDRAKLARLKEESDSNTRLAVQMLNDFCDSESQNKVF